MTKQTETPHDNVTLLPGSGQGTLTTPAGEELPVRTFERGEEVALVVLIDLEDERATDLLEGAELEYTSRRGLIKLQGEAVFEDRSLVRFRPHGNAEVLQRRDFVRVHTPHPVMVDTGEEGEWRVHTVDLSGGGMLLADGDKLAADQTIRFVISVGAGDAPVEGVARVVRVSDDGKRALMFEQIAEHDRQRLIRFVFDCMRAARARTRGDWI
ncbi:MAG: flagellar brake protein [Solirubrobacteraceae bacterium]